MINRCPLKTGQKGFTLVELMTVVGIIAILAVFAFPSYNSLQRHQSLYGTARKIVADIRYAQQIARDQNRDCSVIVQSGSYSIDGRVESFPPGVTSGGYSFIYNYFGIPNSAGTFSVSNGTGTYYIEIFASGRVAVSNALAAVVPVSGVSVSPQSLNLAAGGPAAALTAAVSPPDATYKSVTWVSSNPSAASVSATGAAALVTPLAQGVTVITLTTVDGGFSDSCTVNVSSPVIHVTGVCLDQGSMTLNKGETGSLAATITPGDATNQNVSWASDNPAVAEVSGSGLSATVTAVAKEGTANITVTTEDGSKTATCTVNVSVPVSKVIVHPIRMTLNKGETDGLTATIVPGNATNKNVSWTSDNPAVAGVSGSGLSATVTAVAGGSAKITVTTLDGKKTATCTVTVK